MRKSNYGCVEFLKNVIFLVLTKLCYPTARLIRFPIVVRGKKYIDFGQNLTTGYRCRFEVNGEHDEKCIVFGENVNIGDNVRISCVDKISIGNDVLMGSKVLIIDNSHGQYNGENQDSPDVPPNKRKLVASPICIEDNVWIGENAVIQQGCTIGYGSIIAANSVVTKDVPANSIVGGSPAKLLKIYDKNVNKWLKV